MFKEREFMLHKIFSAVFAASMLFTSLNAAERVVDIRQSAAFNPTLFFSGIPTAPELSTDLRNILGVCGWFDLTFNAAKADYTLRAANLGGNRFKLELFRGKYPAGSWEFAGASSRELAKTITDTIIEHTFAQLKVRGFCRSRIAFTVQTAPAVRNVYVCDIDGRNVRPVTNYRTLIVEPSWSPSGNTIFFSNYHRSGIDVIETTLSTPQRSRRITSFRGINTGAAISPNGANLAVILSPDRQVDLYILGLNQRFRRRLTQGVSVESSPTWSPDGSRIAFVSDRSGSPRIYICDLSGRILERIPTIGRDAVTPAWSKDNKIAYATRTGSGYVIAVYDMNTRKNSQVSKLPGNWESPGWAADNRQVVCKRTYNGKAELHVLDTRTGKSRLLLVTGNNLFDPAWSPCRSR